MVDQVVVVLPLGLVVMVHILAVLQPPDLEEILVVLLLVNSFVEVEVVPVVLVSKDNTHQVHHHILLDKQGMVDWESE
jgi:hypothetical protein